MALMGRRKGERKRKRRGSAGENGAGASGSVGAEAVRDADAAESDAVGRRRWRDGVAVDDVGLVFEQIQRWRLRHAHDVDLFVF